MFLVTGTQSHSISKTCQCQQDTTTTATYAVEHPSHPCRPTRHQNNGSSSLPGDYRRPLEVTLSRRSWLKERGIQNAIGVRYLYSSRYRRVCIFNSLIFIFIGTAPTGRRRSRNHVERALNICAPVSYSTRWILCTVDQDRRFFESRRRGSSFPCWSRLKALNTWIIQVTVLLAGS